MVLTAILIIIAYLLGSVSCSIIICKLTGYADPRTFGSKSAGATNMLRIAGKKLAIYTLIGDIAKGFLAVMLARILGLDGFYLGAVAVAAFIGHIYPVYFGFKGGKGIAVGFGILLAFSPELGGITALTWIVVAVIFRYSSLSSLVAFTLAPIYALFLTEPTYAVPIAIMTLIIIWRHRTNIKRLINKTEAKIGR